MSRIVKYRLGPESARAFHFANKLLVVLLVRVRLSFQKLLQTRQTSRNNKKPSKQVLVMIKHCLRNSQIRYQSRESSCYILKSEQMRKGTAYN